MNYDSLKETITNLTAEFTQLESQLLEEKNWLSGRDLDNIGKIAQEKYLTCQKIRLLEDQIGELSISHQIANFSVQERAELDPVHSSLLTLAARCRDSNAVNGKIIARSQQCARELIGLMSSTNADPLYSQSGQTMAAASGHPIAKV